MFERRDDDGSNMRNVTFFFRFFVWFSLRNMKMHPGRVLTVLFGIALGAAVFTSVRLSINASLDSFTRSMELIAGRADRVLTRPGGYVPEKWVPVLLKHPAVESASPFLTTYVKLPGKDADPFLLIGFDPILDRSIRNWKVSNIRVKETDSWLNLLEKPYTLMIGQPLASRYNLVQGDSITIENARGKSRFRIIGTLLPEGLALVEGGWVAITDIATYQEFTGLMGKVDRIDLRLKPNITHEELKSLESLLDKSLVLSAPSATRESGQKMIRAYQLNLSILSFASLFVGMFLVYSLVALNAASRRHELAVLRSIGASSYFPFLMFLTEGALFGIVGWVTAIPISNILVKYLLAGVSQTISTLFVRVRVESLSLSMWEIVLSFVVTVVISVLAALQPAREAMLVSPVEALESSKHGMHVKKSPHQLALGGLICIIIVLPLSRLPSVLDIPIPGYLAILLLFVGFSLLAPWSLAKTSDIFSPAIRRIAGFPAYLAGRYIKDSGTRTAVSVGALITAVALFASLVIMIYSFRSTVELWAKQTVSGDLFLTMKLNVVNQYRQLIPPEAVVFFKSMEPDVEMVPSRRYFLRYNHFPYEFEVLNLPPFFKYGDFFWMKGNPKNIRPRMRRGEGVVISEVFSNRTKLTVGDVFRARIEGSNVELPILGVVRDYRTHGGVVFYSMQHFKARYHDSRWSGIRFFFKNRSQDLSKAVLRLRKTIIARWGDTLDIMSGRDLRNAILRVFDETFAVTTVLLLIALFIAALGIATTLTVLVLERSRQLNTLYAVGASFKQIRTMIFWEAVFMVVLGEIAGILCGFILSYLLVYVINRQSFGWTFLYEVDWGALSLSLPLIIFTALVAAIPAIRMVFRKPPATLLREQ